MSRCVAEAVITAALRDDVAEAAASASTPSALAAAHAWQPRYLPVVRR